MIHAASFFIFIFVQIAQAAMPEDILKSAWKDPRVSLHQNAFNIAVDAKSYNFLNKVDLRYDRGELDKDNIKYGLRFYPKGFTEIQTTLAFQKAIEQNEQATQDAMLSQLLYSRYELLARIALIKEKKDIATEMGATYRKLNRVLSYGAQKDRAELKAYLKNKADMDKLEIKLADIDRDYQNLQAELKDLSLGSVENFDLHDLASMDDLRRSLETVLNEKPATTLSRQLMELDLAKSRAGMNYERAKDEKWFDYLQLTISEAKKDDDSKEQIYGFEVAFNLPFLAAPNLSRVDKEIHDLHDKAKVIEQAEAADRIFRNGFAELKTLLDIHKNLQETQSRMGLDKMKKASRAIAPLDPALSIELQRGWFESREQLLDLEFRIRSLYILYLHESSVLVKAPDKNYLSKSLKRIL